MVYLLKELPNRLDETNSRVRFSNQTYDVAEYLGDGNDRDSLIAAAVMNDLKKAAELLEGYEFPLDNDSSTHRNRFGNYALQAGQNYEQSLTDNRTGPRMLIIITLVAVIVVIVAYSIDF
ncbi:hypothetical protein MKX01_021965 [Papaver californicum]|nr:hypothetical protein MKX01_021965 [Papaver californicum]